MKAKNVSTGSVRSIEKNQRLTTKASLYREFAHELGKLIPKTAPEDEDCRICGSTVGMSGEDELCDGCFINNED